MPALYRINWFKKFIFSAGVILICFSIAIPAGAAQPISLPEQPAANVEIFLPVILQSMECTQSTNCLQTFPRILADNQDYEFQAIALINQERTSRGLAPLEIAQELTQSARLESRYLADNNYWGHVWPDGTTPWDRIRWACYKYRAASENIAGGYSTPAAVVNAWMNSDGHRANILSQVFTEIGLGYAYNSSSAYGVYWTANFGDR